MINFKKIVTDVIFNLDINLNKEDIEKLIEIPPNSQMGDFSFPCFKLSKTLKKAPNIIAQELVSRINLENSIFSDVKNMGPYINFYISSNEFLKNVVSEVLKKK